MREGDDYIQYQQYYHLKKKCLSRRNEIQSFIMIEGGWFDAYFLDIRSLDIQNENMELFESNMLLTKPQNSIQI